MANSDIEARIDRLVEWYGDGGDGSSPAREQWRRLLDRPADAPVTLVNFFKMRERAQYPDAAEAPGEPESGQDAFSRYGAVSIPTLEKIGGKFLLIAPFEAVLVGESEDWDLIAIGSYPNSAAVLALFEDTGYRDAFHHRTAACERQKVVVGSG
jgi:uncharacterized protein (DUF1330 family)